MNRDGVLAAVGIGVLVTIALSFVPFSSVVGGATAASRRDCGYRSGLGIATAAGGVAMVPLGALFVPALWIAGALGFGVSPAADAYELFLGIVAVLFVLYTVGLSALGGVVGVWIRRHTRWDLDPLAWI
jgi:hypothetical protein